MAIKLKSAALSKPFSYISIEDAAINSEGDDFDEEWLRYRDGSIDSPPLVDGIEPTVWELTPIADSQHQAHLQGILEEHGQVAWAIAYASRGITGASNLEDDSGKTVAIKRERIDGYMTVRPSQLAQIPVKILAEIGRVLITHNSPN